MGKRILFFLISFGLSSILVAAQENLVKNPSAEFAADEWLQFGETGIESIDNNRHFVVRNNKGHFWQRIPLPESARGKFALLIGRGASERVNADGAITGLPYLYGYLMDFDVPTGGRINTFMTLDSLRLHPTAPNEWSVMYGIYLVPKGTVGARVFLNQAERRGVPQNGSAARFDDVGLYLFDTEQKALNFVKEYDRKR